MSEQFSFPEAKQAKIDHILAQICKPGFSTLAHNCRLEAAQSILENGLETRNTSLSQTALPILSSPNPNDSQNREVFENPQTHKNGRYFIILQIPNPSEGQMGGGHYFSRVFRALPPERRVEVGVQGIDRSYMIPPEFIQGYVDLDTLEFTPNPTFNPPDQLQVQAAEMVKGVRPRIKEEIIGTPPASSDDGNWVF